MNYLIKLEHITLNIASFGVIYGSVMEHLPGIVTVFVGLSIVFLNVARGIKALRNKKENEA